MAELKDFEDMPGAKGEGGDFSATGEEPDVLEDLDLNSAEGQNEAVDRLLPPGRALPEKPDRPTKPKPKSKSIIGKMNDQIAAQNNERFWLCIYARDMDALDAWLKEHGLAEFIGRRYVPLVDADEFDTSEMFEEEG